MNSNDKTVAHWVDQFAGRIGACDMCQPFDEGEVVWIEGESQSLRELLTENGVPEEILEFVAEQLACSCGNELQLDSEVIADTISSQIIEDAGERFGWWVVEDIPRFKAFDEYLQKSPKTGRSHQLGQEIYDQLKDLQRQTIGGDWWRARSIDKSNASPALADVGPPLTPPKVAGRFNRVGERVFYLGSDKDAVISEARKHRKANCNLWAQKFQITAIGDIVELIAPPVPTSAFFNTIMPDLFAGLLWCDGLVQQGDGTEEAFEYLLPQYIAECATELGICGITFNSQLHSGVNLVLFAWDDADVVAVGRPELID
jgi:hypothetical protein